MSDKQEAIITHASAKLVVVQKLDLPREMHEKAITEGIPTTLWLGMSLNKEYPPFYRHAWGTAWVSTRQDGGDRYPVDTLRLRIEMPALTGPVTDDQTRNNAAECSADCKFGGTIFGDFSSNWHAWATHKGFGTWDNQTNW
jgi:hypothetical protein